MSKRTTSYQNQLNINKLTASHRVHDLLQDLLADCVVAAGEVVGCVLLARDQLLRVEKLPVGPSANLL